MRYKVGGGGGMIAPTVKCRHEYEVGEVDSCCCCLLWIEVKRFVTPLGTFSGRGDFSLGVNMGSNSIPPKLLRMRV